MAGVYL